MIRIRRQFVVYFCLHRAEFAGKHCKLASSHLRTLSLPCGAQKRQNPQREVTGKSSLTISAKPDGVWAGSQPRRLVVKQSNISTKNLGEIGENLSRPDTKQTSARLRYAVEH